MGKIKKWYRSIPIWLALFMFVITALLVASFLSNKIMATVNDLWLGVQAKYITVSYGSTSNSNDVIYSTDSTSGIVEYDFNYDKYSDEDIQLYQKYSFIQRYIPPFLYTVIIMAAVLIFYFTKLKTPLQVLKKASDRITENELDFALDYYGCDEMASLCAAFEKMRSALSDNNQRMLRMIDQRKQLNDAYTHDLRTPITILKGYTEMLTKYLPSGKMSQEEVVETVQTMSTHVSRLEQFVESMNTVQKLEDLIVQKKPVNTGEVVGHLQESADILCHTCNLSCDFTSEIHTEALLLDAGAVIQVFENLMSNATRFACSKVIIRCESRDNLFCISVSDDGKGFTEKELLKADQPYYSGETQKQGYHFGLGLHICRTLCEKHGGRMQMGNSADGGAIITASFSLL